MKELSLERIFGLTGGRGTRVLTKWTKVEGQPEPDTENGGFTLLELATVMALILILVAIAAPAYRMAIQRAREAVLRSDLHSMRAVIDEFTVDKQRPPESLQELVDAGYIHAIPADPFTGSADTWQADIEQVPVPPDQTATGVVDVHSGSDGKALDGTDYNTW